MVYPGFFPRKVTAFLKLNINNNYSRIIRNIQYSGIGNYKRVIKTVLLVSFLIRTLYGIPLLKFYLYNR